MSLKFCISLKFLHKVLFTFFLSQMSLINLNPLATGFCQCLKCSKSISENQSYLQCDTCMQKIHSNCISRKKSNQQSSSNNVQFTCDSCSKCPVCSKKVAYNHKAVLCEICNTWVHIKCNKLTIDDYEKFQNNANLNFTCLQCHHTTFHLRHWIINNSIHVYKKE